MTHPMVGQRMGDSCQQCGHPFDDHKLIARGKPITEGLVVCPVEECYCLSSFDIPDRTTSEDAGELFHEGTL